MTTTTTYTAETYLVFDVESDDLHGEGFAVGWVVVERRGRLKPKMLADGIAVAPASNPSDWVRENVLPVLPAPGYCAVPYVRDEFWSLWLYWRERNALLAADIHWPVEARFLATCVDDDRAAREWSGPYPLIDIGSVRLGAGLNPLAEVDRLPNELPAHNPLCDARQSARLLLEALAVRGGR